MKRENVPPLTRSAMRRHYKNRCQYCGVVTEDPEVDHIVPVMRGGTNSLDNLTLACQPCNVRKMDIPLDEMFTAIAHARAAKCAPAIEAKISALKNENRKTRSGPEVGKLRTLDLAGQQVRYFVERNRKSTTSYYWLPSPRLVRQGFHIVRLSDSLDLALREARALNKQLDGWYARTGKTPRVERMADYQSNVHLAVPQMPQ